MITNFIFHPRKGYGSIKDTDSTIEITIPVDKDTQIGARFFKASESSPTILFFHGNGEIVDDYNDLAPIFTKIGVNFLPVDYRGYGNSTGSPSVSSMMGDSHKILKYIKNWLKEKNFIRMDRDLEWVPFRHTFSHFHLHIHPVKVSVKPASAVMDDDNLRWYKLDQQGLKLGMPAPIIALLSKFNQ